MRGLLIDPGAGATATAARPTVALDRSYRLSPRVALRPEPFGALAYHFGNRRLSFLRSPDIVAVVESLADHPTLADALCAAGIDERRWPSFVAALGALVASEMVEESNGGTVEERTDG